MRGLPSQKNKLLLFFYSAPERAALRSSGECAVRRGLWPGCAGHRSWLGPHYLLPKALLRWYVGISGGSGWAVGGTQWCMCGRARIILWHEENLKVILRSLSGEVTYWALWGIVVGVPVTHIQVRVTGMALSGRGMIWYAIGRALGDDLGTQRDQLL